MDPMGTAECPRLPGQATAPSATNPLGPGEKMQLLSLLLQVGKTELVLYLTNKSPLPD